MKLLRLYADFGKLKHAELVLKEGLNPISLPNEGGKTTWCAFLLAMFYGIDTAERASKDTLPAKQKYKPWDGTPMSGRIELEWQGRFLTIERSSAGKIPMGTFSAYESRSGIPVPELTADNCGRKLLGVERSVFERSAFLREREHGITPDSTLEQRLLALVSTGEERVSYKAAMESLKAEKNACRYHNKGEIPRTEEELSQAREKRAAAERRLRELAGLRASEQQLEEKRTQIREQIEAFRAEKEAEYRETARKAAETAAELRQNAERCDAEADGLPAEAVLRQRLEQRRAAAGRREQLLRTLPAEPEKPEPPRESWGGNYPENTEKPEHILKACDAAAARRKNPLLPVLLLAALVFLGAGIALLAAKFTAAAVCLLLAGGAFAISGVIFLLSERKKQNRLQANLYRALQSISVEDAETLRRLLADYRQRQLQYEEISQTRAAERERIAALIQKEEETLAAIDAACLQDGLPESGESALSQAIACRERQRHAGEQAAKAEEYAATLSAMFTDDTGGALRVRPPKELGEALRDCDGELAACRSTIDRLQGVLSAEQGPDDWAAECGRLETKLSGLELKNRALERASAALELANETLQRRFAPQISSEASAIFSRLSGGRYDRVLLNADLRATAGEHGEIGSRQDSYLSRGTTEQLYFAVRMAICKKLLPADAPLILDDAFVNFDAARMGAALDFLREESANRQILLFTCTGREKDCLA